MGIDGILDIDTGFAVNVGVFGIVFGTDPIGNVLIAVGTDDVDTMDDMEGIGAVICDATEPMDEVVIN
eukprot:CAMPEP_0201577668 /NCGR_PEP_ID=MMETSP0190_2-20130828/24152_1 /ASSEMBLY_ACC=CAM_ASM_000263 /TAXON_ID=37353 /ORGANISM="Rosalina sp." /LENGTH=67 /DNA_ID=CAMNT_0048009937 /DNA_START=324 /DNA_END=527 /DNA_ORIENTATION=+